MHASSKYVKKHGATKREKVLNIRTSQTRLLTIYKVEVKAELHTIHNLKRDLPTSKEN